MAKLKLVSCTEMSFFKRNGSLLIIQRKDRFFIKNIIDTGASTWYTNFIQNTAIA